jgi:hypothetical protein
MAQTSRLSGLKRPRRKSFKGIRKSFGNLNGYFPRRSRLPLRKSYRLKRKSIVDHFRDGLHKIKSSITG